MEIVHNLSKVKHRLLPEFIHRWYANIFGYFWLRCKCGKMFGGHEVSEITAQVTSKLKLKKVICSDCVIEYLKQIKK